MIAADDISAGLPDRVMRKAQWRLLPLIFLAYLIAIVDRLNISFAAATMNADLGFTATVYGLAGGIFFVSYALLEVPSNMAMMRFGSRIWLTRIMITWGLISAAQMFVQTPMQFYVLRFLLGAAEAGFFPAILFYASLWFPAKWRGRAISRFYVAQPVSQILMGLVSGPILGLDGMSGLQGWQWLFLLEAIPAILMGIIIFKFLPDGPAVVSWLEPDERQWLTGALATDEGAITSTKHDSVMRAIADKPVLLFGLVWFFYVGAVNAFYVSAPQILGLKTGLGTQGVGLLVAAGGVLGAFALIGLGWHSDRRQERFWHILAPAIMVAASIATLATGPSPALAALAALTLAVTWLPSQPVFFSALSETLHERHRAVGVAAVNTFGQFGSFLSISAFGVAKDATGTYDLGLAAMAVSVVIGAGILNHIRRAAQRKTLPQAVTSSA
ncbi:MFS transporter [Sandarakinorhabdus sp.]|uniref:MFS transporter n=1 Tax=Sandarakinorhabdus sp. TaxID=1916663 RepID=UPI00286DEEBF|nr:MFS transporter [Sandarakinorhabdus sp.]